MSKGFVRHAFELYEQRLHTQPLITKAVTSAAVGASGDLTCQLCFERRAEVSWWRLGTFTFLSGVLVAPVLHRWYSYLHRHFPGESAGTVARRLLLDQLLFAPCFIPTFMVSLHTLEGEAAPLRKAQHQWWPAVCANWQLWVPAQVINFRFVPVPWQVLFANGVALVWNVYLSAASHHGGGEDGVGAAHTHAQSHRHGGHAHHEREHESPGR